MSRDQIEQQYKQKTAAREKEIAELKAKIQKNALALAELVEKNPSIGSAELGKLAQDAGVAIPLIRAEKDRVEAVAKQEILTISEEIKKLTGEKTIKEKELETATEEIESLPKQDEEEAVEIPDDPKEGLRVLGARAEKKDARYFAYVQHQKSVPTDTEKAKLNELTQTLGPIREQLKKHLDMVGMIENDADRVKNTELALSSFEMEEEKYRWIAARAKFSIQQEIAIIDTRIKQLEGTIRERAEENGLNFEEVLKELFPAVGPQTAEVTLPIVTGPILPQTPPEIQINYDTEKGQLYVSLVNQISNEEKAFEDGERELTRLIQQDEAEQTMEFYANLTKEPEKKPSPEMAALRAELAKKLKLKVAELADRVEDKNPFKWYAANLMVENHRAIIGLENAAITDETMSAVNGNEIVKEFPTVSAEKENTIDYTENGYVIKVLDNKTEGGDRSLYINDPNYRFTVYNADGKPPPLGKQDMTYEEARSWMAETAKRYDSFFLHSQFNEKKELGEKNDEAIKKLQRVIDDKIEEFREAAHTLAEAEAEKETSEEKGAVSEEDGDSELLNNPRLTTNNQGTSDMFTRANTSLDDDVRRITPIADVVESDDASNVDLGAIDRSMLSTKKKSASVNDTEVILPEAVEETPEGAAGQNQTLSEEEPVAEPATDEEKEVSMNEFGFPENFAKNESIKALNEIREKLLEAGGVSLGPLGAALKSAIEKVYADYIQYDDSVFKFDSASPLRGAMMSDLEHLAMTHQEKIEYFNKKMPEGFPIKMQGVRRNLKWEAIVDYELWVILNYGRTLSNIKWNGGLSPREVKCILSGLVNEAHGRSKLASDEEILEWLEENDMLKPEESSHLSEAQ